MKFFATSFQFISAVKLPFQSGRCKLQRKTKEAKDRGSRGIRGGCPWNMGPESHQSLARAFEEVSRSQNVVHQAFQYGIRKRIEHPTFEPRKGIGEAVLKPIQSPDRWCQWQDSQDIPRPSLQDGRFWQQSSGLCSEYGGRFMGACLTWSFRNMYWKMLWEYGIGINCHSSTWFEAPC